MSVRRVLLLIVAVLALTGCAGSNAPQTTLVQIRDGGFPGGGPVPGIFDPAALVIAPGTEVRWRNEGAEVHTVTTQATDVAGQPALPVGAEPWDSGPLWPGGTFAHRFETEGTYVYWCTNHQEEQMVGTIRVEQP